MNLDPWLYGALLAGLAAGYAWPGPHRGVAPLTLGVIGLLVALLGLELGRTAGTELLGSVPEAVALAALVVAFTAGAAFLLDRRRARSTRAPAPLSLRAVATGPALLGILLVAIASAPRLPAVSPTAVSITLDALVALVAFEIRLTRSDLADAGLPVLGAIAGALCAGLVFAWLAGWSWSLGLTVTFGFGWYTLTGPVVAARFGATLGLVAFLANFLRESLTMLLAPGLGRVGGTEAIAAVGGATSMDTTLYFVQRFGSDRPGAIGIVTGLTLTLLAALLVPTLAGFPWP